MFTESILPFIIACLVIEATPGPNMGYLGMVTLDRGRRAGLTVVAGVALGLFLIGLIVLSGASFLWEDPAVYRALKICGVAYMLWLAYDCWRLKPQGDIASRGRLFLRGFITNLLNPKVVIFYVTLIPPFAGNGAGSYARALALMCISVFIATLSHMLVVFLTAWVKRVFNISSRDMWVRLLFALLLIGVAFWIAAAH